MRWRSKPWMKEAIKKYYGSYLLEPCERPQDVFETGRPLWLEIGTGMGAFINNMALLYPEINFLGVERATEVAYRALEMAEALERHNVRMVNRDVLDVIAWLDGHRVDRIFLNFSDPWPKNGHAKRRLTHINYLNKYRNMLKFDGLLIMKTDNESLFDWSLEQFALARLNFINISRDWHSAADYSTSIDVMTEYEQRFSALGQKIFRVVADFR